MSQKRTKKIYSQRQHQKKKVQFNRAKTQRLRNLALGSARRKKEAGQVWNANNTNESVPVKHTASIVEPVNNSQTNVVTLNNNNNNENLPNNYPSFSEPAPRKGKYLRLETRKRSNKNKLAANRAQSQKLRNRKRQRARLTKEDARLYENADFNEANVSISPENMMHNDWYRLSALHNQMVSYNNYPSNLDNNDLDRMEQEYEKREYEKAKEKMKKAQKNTFYIRVGGDTTLTLKKFVENLHYYSTNYKIEILYLSSNPKNTYYEILKFQADDDNNNDYGYGYNQENQYREGYVVYKEDPVEFFKPKLIPHHWNFYGPNNNNDYNVALLNVKGFVPRSRIRKYLQRLPYLMDTYRRQEQARISGRSKLEALRMKAVESAVGQFEGKTGRTVPRNAQNIIEQMIKPIDYRYYQGRDNLQRINTSLFQNE